MRMPHQHVSLDVVLNSVVHTKELVARNVSGSNSVPVSSFLNSFDVFSWNTPNAQVHTSHSIIVLFFFEATRGVVFMPAWVRTDNIHDEG